LNKPKLWLSGPGSYTYRVVFHFVDEAGKSLQTRTWELRKEPHEAPRVYMLQARAKLVAAKPTLEELGHNYVSLTTVVVELEGELRASSLPASPETIWHEQLAAFPLTLGVVLGDGGLTFTLHTAKPKAK